MFATRYFPARLFAPRYWPKVGAEASSVTVGSIRALQMDVRIRSLAQAVAIRDFQMPVPIEVLEPSEEGS